MCNCGSLFCRACRGRAAMNAIAAASRAEANSTEFYRALANANAEAVSKLWKDNEELKKENETLKAENEARKEQMGFRDRRIELLKGLVNDFAAKAERLEQAIQARGATAAGLRYANAVLGRRVTEMQTRLGAVRTALGD